MSSSSSASATATSSAPAATSSAVTHTLQASKNLKVVGIILAIVSGLLIGSSFVVKKKGLLRSQAGHAAGEGVAYLKSALWWAGMIMMILGEICNFAAYAFVEAIVVTPLGALSVVICAILSSLFLNEKLSFFGWLGCALCILGSTIIALNGPKEASVGQIREFQKLFLAPGFLAYAGTLIAISLVIIFYFAPKYGKKSMLWYIFVCSMIGGISVSVTTGLGAAIVQTAMGDNQFKYWFMYFLGAFVIVTLLTEVYYLNVALALFNTAMVTPTYYVIFTFFSMATTVVLFQGLKASAAQILTIVMAFLSICIGITILQMSKVDPEELASVAKLDRRSTILLQAARSKTENTEVAEKDGVLVGVEDPGMDALRGSFGTVGSIIRARSVRRLSQRKATGSTYSTAYDMEAPPFTEREITASPTHHSPPNPFATQQTSALANITRHQLYDAPMPRVDSPTSALPHSPSGIMKRPTIKFDSQDVVHSYHPPGTGDNSAKHEHRLAAGGSPGPSSPAGYPPIRTSPKSLFAAGPQMPSAGSLSSSSGLGSAQTIEDDDSSAQKLPLLHRFTEEHEVHSAPPTVGPQYSPKAHHRPPPRQPARMDSRDIFGPGGSPTDTLDSGTSAQERARSAKKYPKGDGEDDREESVSLWRGSRKADFDDDDEYSQPAGGIRLVTPTTGQKF
ncbi:hypothetical protein HGRIS_003081 [Hohenbuehelia grisea]|uniref:DUF803-domain-containing protein n=1 Tax=Hohenbuehelia grisea TaxID=104357 RepID=A0ABR3JP97_9AGAR